MDNEAMNFYREQAMRLRRLGWDWEDVREGHRRLERIQARLEGWCDAGHAPITVEEWGGIVDACREEEAAPNGVEESGTKEVPATEEDGGPEKGGKLSTELGSGEDGRSKEETDNPADLLADAIFGSTREEIVDPIVHDEGDGDADAEVQKRENEFAARLAFAPNKVRILLVC